MAFFLRWIVNNLHKIASFFLWSIIIGMKRRISIIGSTGSIGTQALEVIEKLQDKFEIVALAAGSNSDKINEQIAKFKPK